MSSILRGNVKIAVASVRSTKWRSVLTMMGIIIAISSVVTVVSVGEGIKHQVNDQISQLGKDLITIRPGQLVTRGTSGKVSGVNIFTGLNATSGGSLTQQDLKSVQQTRGVKLAVPLSIVTGTVKSGSKQLKSGSVIATTNDLPSLLHQSIAYGDFFNSDVNSQPNVAVIGKNVAESLFGQSVPLGQGFTFLGQTFVVRGIFDQFDTAPLSLSTDFNDSIFIPYQTAQQLTNNNAQIYEILAKPTQQNQADATVRNINDSLSRAHNSQQQFTVLPQNESLTVTNNILDLLTRLIVGIAAISLLVGGIGIMDVMLVSVTERMHEIGIRKAIGATNRQILVQFLTESTVLSFAGGLAGIVVSFLVEFLLRSFTNLTPIITWQIVVIATIISILVGVIFGSAPALKAARKDPIDALRNE